MIKQKNTTSHGEVQLGFLDPLVRSYGTDVVPGAAEKWEISGDGVTYTFHLRDAKWSDGVDVTADDFVQAFVRMFQSAPASAIYDDILNGAALRGGTAKPEDLGVKAPDPKTVVFTLRAPAPYFLGLLTSHFAGPGRADMIEEMMNLVGLDGEHLNRFPHEFSGGQRQRIAIARALVLNPEFVICDEPISALDVSIQGQIVNLLKDLQRRIGLTYLFIAHDLSMVKYISDRVGVMYLGRLVEVAPKKELFENPRHPYTQALLSAVPIPDPRRERARTELTPQGELPSPMQWPALSQ